MLRWSKKTLMGFVSQFTITSNQQNQNLFS
jgi:hypothetical protein